MQVRAAKSGVGQYIYALMDSMSRLAPDDDFLIYCNAANEPNYKFPTPNSSTKTWGLNGAPRAVRLSYEAAFLPKEIGKAGLDLFHGASNFLPALPSNCPYVVTVHDLSYHVHPERCPPVRRYYWYAMTRRTIALAERIITISENSRRDIERFFPGTGDKIRVIPEAAHSRFQPVNTSREKSGLQRFEEKLGGRPYLLYLGTLEPGKNVARIIQAFDRVVGRFPEHQLVLAGDKGWLFEPIFETMNQSPYRDRIHYLGHVSDSEAVDLFNFADVFVFPSLYEGFGLPPLEAMACGCPVITSNTSSIPEVVGDAAVKVNPLDVEELTNALQRVLENGALRQDLGAAGLVQAARFSWDKCAQETLAVYKEAMK